jgi:hypothetical protein
LLSFIPLCRFISSNVSDIELNYFGGLQGKDRGRLMRERIGIS